MTLSVGITGGIGSGKSTVCRLFQLLGVPIYYADNAAKSLMEHNLELRQKIEVALNLPSNLPFEAFKSALGEQIFSHPNQKKKLEALVHPAVASDFDHWLAEQQTPFVLKEAAILFETGSYKTHHHNILVTAPEPVRLARVLARDAHLTEVALRARMATQWTDEQKIKLADFHIDNSGRQLLLPQIFKIYEDLIRRSNSRG
jgi:dephospho-CoA kinase